MKPLLHIKQHVPTALPYIFTRRRGHLQDEMRRARAVSAGMHCESDSGSTMAFSWDMPLGRAFGTHKCIATVIPARLASDEACVVPLLHSAVVDSHAEQIVQLLRARLRCELVCTGRVCTNTGGSVWPHVERVKWKFYKVVNLCRRLLVRRRVLEPLQMKAKNIGQTMH